MTPGESEKYNYYKLVRPVSNKQRHQVAIEQLNHLKIVWHTLIKSAL